MFTREGAAPAVLTAFALASSAPLGKKLSTWSSRELRATESFVTGACLAFVIVDLLTELAEGARAHPSWSGGRSDEMVLFALVLLAATSWFVLGVLAASRGRAEARYWIYVLPQAIYCAFVGEALALEAQLGAWPLLLFAPPILLHLTVIESHMQLEFPRQHRGLRRAALAVVPGLAASAWAVLGLSHDVLIAALALVAGSTVVQIMQTELPPIRLIRVWPFVGGVVVYSAMVAARWAGAR